MQRATQTIILALTAAGALSACSHGGGHRRGTEATRAVARLLPTEGSSAQGTVWLTADGDQVLVRAEVTGLSPGKHGFHVHEYGDCTDLAGRSAGGHFDPAGSQHGGPAATERHAGDLGNLEAGPDGRATLEWRDPQVRLAGRRSVLARAVVVHEGEDDLTSQPTGNAGARAACGVIGVAKP